MNISEQIIQVLDDLCRRFGIVIDWSKETVAPYLEELATKFITFEVKTSWFWIFSSVIVTVIAWVLFIIFYHIDPTDTGVIVGVVAFCITVVFILITGVQVYDIITCETFPEKILLREIEELLQKY